MAPKLRDRPAGEIVILILAGCVGVLILTTGIGLILAAIFHPEEDTAEAARGIADIINTIVGALIGYLAGSRTKAVVEEPEDEPKETP